jgi:ferredoxin
MQSGSLEVETMSSFEGVSVNRGKCISCGLCIRVCPQGIFEMIDGTINVSSERAHLCMYDKQCQHVCSVDAITIADKK